MVTVCILIRVARGKHEAVLNAVKGEAGVKDAFFTFGRYDAVAFAQVKDAGDAGKLAAKLNGIAGVRSTETLIEM